MDSEYHHIKQSLQNGTEGTFESVITFSTPPVFNNTGLYNCVATSVFVSANNSETSATITSSKCAFATNAATMICGFLCSL